MKKSLTMLAILIALLLIAASLFYAFQPPVPAPVDDSPYPVSQSKDIPDYQIDPYCNSHDCKG